MPYRAPLQTRFQALQAVRALFETQQQMADAFGVSQPTVWRWINKLKQLPVKYVLDAERLTGVSRHALRPDYYPVEHAGSPEIRTILADCGHHVHTTSGGVPNQNTIGTSISVGLAR